MIKKSLNVLLILSFAAGLTCAVFAQRQTGSIKGVIIDTEGTELPGVTVTASSEALMGTQSYVTEASGAFRFPALPPGIYTIRAEMPGFKTTTRGDLVVRVGMVLSVNISMEVVTLEEEMTVTATPPVIDVQQTKITVTVDKEMLRNIPVTRDIYDIINIAPGAVSEDVLYRRTTSIHGGTVKDNTYSIDGVDVSDPGWGYPQTNLNFEVIDEIEMITASHPADSGQKGGAYINVVTRSGGNKLTGGALLYYANDSFVQQLWTDEQIQSIEVTKPVTEKLWLDGSLSLGGPIIRDKLWFFLNGRYMKQEKNTNFIPFTDPLGQYHGTYPWIMEEKMAFAKLTWQITPSLKLSSMFNYDEPYRNLGIHEPEPYLIFQSSQRWDDVHIYTANTILTYIADQNTFFDLRFGYSSHSRPTLIQKEAEGLPLIRDYALPYGELTSRGRSSYNLRQRFDIRASFTRFQDYFFGGSHEIKGGLEFENSGDGYDWWTEDNLVWHWYNGSPYYFGTTTWNGVPNVGKGRIYFYACGTEKGKTYTENLKRRYGAFIQDSITFGKRLTVNIGLRFDRTSGWHPDMTKGVSGNPLSVWLGETLVRSYTKAMWPDAFPDGLNPYGEIPTESMDDLVVWNSFSPRIGISYDLFGDQKTALRASFSRYSQYLFMGSIHPFSKTQSFRFDWYDTNFNGTLEDTDDYIIYPQDYRVLNMDYARQLVDPDLTSPYTHEFTCGVLHELFRNFSLGVSFIYKEDKNIMAEVPYALDIGEYWYHYDQAVAKKYWVPFTTIVPGTGDYSDETVTFYARKNDAPSLFYRLANVPELSRKYRSFDFLFQKRMANGWQFSGSIIFGNSYGNFGGLYRKEENIDPNYFINRWGRQNVDRALTVKLMGSVQIPFGIILSGYFRHIDGSPWGRSASIRPPQDWCEAQNVSGEYYYVYIEPRDARRTKSIDILDLRLDKEFRIGDFGRLGASIDIFNVLGWSTMNVGKKLAWEVFSYTQNDVNRYNPSAENVSERENVILDSSYGRIAGVDGIRSVKFSIRFHF